MSSSEDVLWDVFLYGTLFLFIVLAAGFGAYGINKEADRENDRSRQYLELDKDWVDGNCVTPPK